MATGAARRAPGGRRVAEVRASKRTGSFSTMRFSTGSAEADRNACCAVGTLSLLALASNAFLSHDISGEAASAEVIGFLLGVVCLWTPRGNDVLEGIERKRSGSGSRSTRFTFLPSARRSALEELAWASYALLASTSAELAVILEHDHVICARSSFDCSLESVEPRAAQAAEHLNALDLSVGTASELTQLPGCAACAVPSAGATSPAYIVLLDAPSPYSWRALGRLQSIASKLTPCCANGSLLEEAASSAQIP